VTVSRRFLEKLEAAKDALSHERPGASAEEILEAGLDLLLAEHAKRKGLVEKPRKDPRPSRADAVPAHVKRAVWIRAGGRCEFRLESGAVCGCTTRLEFDHVVPRAQGGPSTIDNVRLTCGPHNLLAARLVFGDACMDRYARKRRGAGSPRGASP
jgi:5-methylcytosine-specific restriction endonuclease McrA